jgi:murein DD-endopeptidase MepM/ murein hydrolase activator NlpD
MTFATLLAISVSVPAYAVTPDASPRTAQGGPSAGKVQSLSVGSAAPVTVQRDRFTAAAAPRPRPRPRPKSAPKAVRQTQPASTIIGSIRGWAQPVSGSISSPFGPRPNAPVGGVSGFHKGTDIAAPCGQPVFAAAAGTVVAAGYQGSYGNWILIDHGNGVQTGYAHSSQLLVSVGQRVAAGATIALVGTTGSSTGCHVHFETRVNGTQVDPVPFMSTRSITLG